MSIALPRTPLISAEDYLANEEASPIKHEYVEGMVYAREGGTQRHCALVGNICATLHARLRGHSCHPYGSDMLVQVRSGNDLRYYYPDLSIICRPTGWDARVQTASADCSLTVGEIYEGTEL